MSVVTGIADALPGRRREAELFAALLDGLPTRDLSGARPVDLAARADLADLAALTRTLVPVEHVPRSPFRMALRERLVTEANSRVPAVPAQRDAAVAAGAPARPRLRRAVATVALAAVVTGVGASAASTRALPGDSLYGLKRQIESVQLALAGSDLERGRELLEQANSRLGEAERLAASSEVSAPETQRALVETLDDMTDATAEGATALTDSYRETGDEEPIVLLDRFVADQRERLQDLMMLLDPGLRERLAGVLETLASIERTTTALLGTATDPVSSASPEAGRASGDGWAVSRLQDQALALADDAGLAAGPGDASTDGEAGTAGGGLVGDVLDTVDGTLGGGGSGSTSGGTSSGSGGLVGGDGKVSTPTLDPVTPLPLPLPTTEPLPTSDPLPSIDPSTVTSPLPTVSVCVPVPPLTTC
ncbi:MAG TPA: DUF5667 domain-containing protein [Actinomycetes bacterium]